MPEPTADPPSPREQLRERQKAQALRIHASDPDMPLADIARRVGVRRKSVSDWVNEMQRAREKG